MCFSSLLCTHCGLQETSFHTSVALGEKLICKPRVSSEHKHRCRIWHFNNILKYWSSFATVQDEKNAGLANFPIIFYAFLPFFSWTLFLNFWHSNIVSEKFRCFLQIVFVSKIAKGGWDWLHTMLVLYSVSVVLWYHNQQNFAHVKRLK